MASVTTHEPIGVVPSQRLDTLFADTRIEDSVLLSVSLLGKPTALQLYRLLKDQLSGKRALDHLLFDLSRGKRRILDRIEPLDTEDMFKKLPFIYLDTTQSRRQIERAFGVPFRRPPEKPTRVWRFLYHDVTLCDDLVAFELTSRRYGLPFGYQSHFAPDGSPLYPEVTITDGELLHTLRPRPDKTLIINGYHIVHEHDCGEESVQIGHIMRDNTIARKHLVYEQVERSGVLDQLGWHKRLYTFLIDGRKRTQKSSCKRIKRCLETLPATVTPQRIFFVDRQNFLEAGDDISRLQWLRADDRAMALPCF